MQNRLRLALVMGMAVVLLAPAAHASRRGGLGGNILIEDPTDMFFFPHKVAQYVNYVWFDFVTGVGVPVGSSGTGDPNLGSGGIMVGNATSHDFGIGIATHRSDYQSALSAVVSQNALVNQTQLGDLFHLLANQGADDSEPIYAPLVNGMKALQWLDLLAGFSVSNTLDLGVRLSVGSNVLDQSDRSGDNAGDNNPGTSFTSFNVLFSGGYTTTKFKLDAAVELNIASLSFETPDVSNSGSGFGFGIGGRAFYTLADQIDLGLLAGLEIRSRSTNFDQGAGTDTDVSELAFSLGAGPRYRVGDKAIVAAYATLGVAQRTVDPSGSDNLQDLVAWLLPGVTISAEWYLTPFFTYRAGLVSQYSLLSGEQQDASATGGTDTTARNLFFYWANGIGFTALEGDFHLDAMLNWPIITNGPAILSGTANPMFAMVTASYTF
jgi:hypothetical protein